MALHSAKGSAGQLDSPPPLTAARPALPPHALPGKGCLCRPGKFCQVCRHELASPFLPGSGLRELPGYRSDPPKTAAAAPGYPQLRNTGFVFLQVFGRMPRGSALRVVSSPVNNRPISTPLFRPAPVPTGRGFFFWASSSIR